MDLGEKGEGERGEREREGKKSGRGKEGKGRRANGKDTKGRKGGKKGMGRKVRGKGKGGILCSCNFPWRNRAATFPRKEKLMEKNHNLKISVYMPVVSVTMHVQACSQHMN